MRCAIHGLCRSLLAEGRTIVLITHHFEEVEAICDRVAVLVRGRVAALDTKERLASGMGGLEAAVMNLVRAEGP
jgi:ABC-2 type transport system ATP-binding protein